MLAFLHCADKPSVPVGPLDITDVTESTAKLSWKPPTNDGGQPITDYLVEVRERSTWTKVCSTKTTSCEATGLRVGSDYLFRVTAVNAEGQSAPLMADKSIKPKKQICKWKQYTLSFTLFQLRGPNTKRKGSNM